MPPTLSCRAEPPLGRTWEEPPPESTPTFSVNQVPRIITASRSRPWLSVPRGFASEGGLLGRAEQADGARIFIGSENKLFSLSGSSTIVAPYRDGAGRIVGVIGVIGPTRLNYARVIPMVDYTARVVSRLLSG